MYFIFSLYVWVIDPACDSSCHWRVGESSSELRRQGPQIHDPHRLNSRRLDLVEGADALGLVAGLFGDGFEASLPGKAVGFELVAFVFGEVEGELVGGTRVGGAVALGLDALALGAEELEHGGGLVLGAFFELGFEVKGALLGLGEKSGLEVADVLWGEGLEAAGGDVGGGEVGAPGEGVVEVFEEVGDVEGIEGGEGVVVAVEGCGGDELVMEAGAAVAVEGEASDEEDAGDVFIDADDAGAGEVVVDEALGDEAAEEALDEAVFEVEVNVIAVEVEGIAEDDGSR